MAAPHQLIAAGLAEGDFLAVRYRVGGRRLWHRRLVVALVPGGATVAGIMTPDLDEYDEDVADQANIAEWTMLPLGTIGPAAPAMGNDDVYDFRHIPLQAAVDAARTAAYARRGAVPVGPIVVNLAGRVGAGAPVGAAPPAAGGAAAAAAGGPGGGGGLAGLVAALGGPAGGPAVAAAAPAALVPVAAPAAPAAGAGAPPAGPGAAAAIPGAPVAPAALAAPGAPAAAAAAPAAGAPAAPAVAGPGGDARIFGVVVDARGVRHVDFRTAVTRMTELPWPDWPVRGPRTLRWVAEFMAQRSGTPTAHHQRWLAETGLDPADPGVEIHQTGCVILETVQEEKYRFLVEPDDASAADRSAMMGTSQLAGSACVCPALRDYLASELQKEMAVAKERRKAPVPQAAMPSLPEGGRLGPPPPSLLQASAGANSAARASGEAGPPSREDGRQRNLFLLPQLTAADAAPGPSRTRRRARAGHALGHALDRASAAMHALNYLYGDKSSPESAVPTAGQRCAVGHIWDTAAALGPEPDECRDDVSDPNGALRELLAGSALHPDGSGPTTPYVPDLVSWPDVSQPPAPLLGLLGERGAAALQAGDVRLSIGSADLDVAFYHVQVPAGMEEFFTLPPIPAKYLMPFGCVEAGTGGDDLLPPQVAVPPMGFSWALHLRQTVLQTSLCRAGFSPENLILDGHSGCQLSGDPSSVVGAGYVDNYFVLGGSPKHVGEQLQAITDDLQRHGLAVHDVEEPFQDCDFLGPSLREGRWLSLRTRNIWRLRAAIRGALRRQLISGFLLRVLTGHITWALLLRREMLCVLGATYAFVQATGPTAAPLWPAARQELQLIHDLLPLCTADLGAPWHGRVACADASPWGLGVVARRAPKDLVGATGVSEETDAAADLGYPPSLDSSDNANVNPGGKGAQDELGRSVLDPRPPVDFEEVPAHFIRESAWGSVAAVFVDGQANILALEGEALVLGYRHLLRSTSSFGPRFFALSDNLPLVLSVGKGRARSRHLQCTLRKICALSVATGSTLSVRWIPSEANPADGRSRGRAGWFSGSRPAPALPGVGLLDHAAALELAAAAAPVLGLSLLERLPVRPSTEKLYRGALSAFASFCARHRLDWTDHASLDSVLVQYMDSEFLLGGGGNMGNVLLAAVAHFLGSLHKRAATQLPRAHRAAAAWARRAPGRTRLPLPRRVVFAIAGVLLRDGHSRLAICILVMFACYLRPGEAAKLRRRHLIAPSASAGTLYQYFGLLLHESGKDPGKTGVNDESILFDREGWLAPLLAALKLSTLPDQPLRGETIAQLPKLFDSACRELSLERLRPHLYSLRHGGASGDMLSQRRSLPEIQRRGRRRSAKSLNRHTKETKLLDELAWIPPAALELGAFVEDNLMALVEGSLSTLLATGRVPAGAAGLL
ncbi:unnamed protein product, partial [Prorocentrum cordatum]